MKRSEYPYSLHGTRQKGMKKYVLQKEAFGLPKGTIFVHDTEDTIVGSLAEGCLKLAWMDDGMCQDGAPVGESFILHADVRNNPEWFKEELDLKSELKQKLHKMIDEIFGK